MIKKLMNPDANANNTRVVHQQESGCCPELKNCMYELDLTGTKAVTSLVIEDQNGVQVTESFSSQNSVSGIQSALIAALVAQGYEATYEDVDYLSGDGVLVTDEGGGTYNIKIFGDAVPLKIVSNSADFTFTKKCNPTALYTCTFLVDDDTQVGNIAYAGSSEAVGDASGYSSAETAAFATAVGTALDNLGIVYESVTVTNAAGVHTVTMKVVGVECSLITVGGVSTNTDASNPYFTA